MPFEQLAMIASDSRAFLAAASAASKILPAGLFAITVDEHADPVAEDRVPYVTLTPTRMAPLGVFQVWPSADGAGFDVLRLDEQEDEAVPCGSLTEAAAVIRRAVDQRWSEAWGMRGRIDDALAAAA